jgi:predicted Ser/Thr protein kinase
MYTSTGRGNSKKCQKEDGHQSCKLREGRSLRILKIFLVTPLLTLTWRAFFLSEQVNGGWLQTQQ